ncbi:MAG: 2-oxoglutarate dehydrogenase complex dihydrolipoyllysine-residue succinyltransferase [Bacteroidales bacterium]
MEVDIKVPEAGESITEVEVAKWLVADGDYVEKDQEIAEIDSDKATLTVNAETAGRISIVIEEGTTTEPGKVIAKIDTGAEAPADQSGGDTATTEENSGEEIPGDKSKEDKASAGETAGGKAVEDTGSGRSRAGKETAGDADTGNKEPDKADPASSRITLSPQAKRLLDEEGISTDPKALRPGSKRITRKDLLMAIAGKLGGAPTDARTGKEVATPSWGGGRDEDRQKMSTLRKKVAQRLVSVRNETAMLTTFNEVDMTTIMQLRKQYQSAFVDKYGFKLGFMSFFVKAITESIPHFPLVNARIDGDHIIIPDYADVGIAVSTPKGLMVPVIRNAEQITLAGLEEYIGDMAERARNNKISIEELSGGTISITNGGVFGSMLSTPILNPPQSAILGMQKIMERPVAIDGKVEIRPMMYLALSYDHRIIDGKESVSFLVKVKEMLENPALLLTGGKDPGAALMGL